MVDIKLDGKVDITTDTKKMQTWMQKNMQKGM